MQLSLDLVHCGVKLDLDIGVLVQYRSPTQLARVLTQSWATENLYCPACESPSLQGLAENNPVADLVCPSCTEPFQLKSQRRPFGHRVVDGAYKPMMDALRSDNLPSFVFIGYAPIIWKVLNVFVVPKYFFSESTIERRPELSMVAQRHGWVGCHISLQNLPRDAKIPVIYDQFIIPENVVRQRWQRFAFLQSHGNSGRGWTADVLACVRDLNKEIFNLRDVYAFENRLAQLHPRNRNVRPKIRQQLQVLRDHGVLGFLGPGLYRVS